MSFSVSLGQWRITSFIDVTEFLQPYRAIEIHMWPQGPHPSSSCMKEKWEPNSLSSKNCSGSWPERQRNSYTWKQTLTSSNMPRLLHCTQEALCTCETRCMLRKESPGSVGFKTLRVKWQSKKDKSYSLTDGKTWDALHLSSPLDTLIFPAEEKRPMEHETIDSLQNRSQLGSRLCHLRIQVWHIVKPIRYTQLCSTFFVLTFECYLNVVIHSLSPRWFVVAFSVLCPNNAGFSSTHFPILNLNEANPTLLCLLFHVVSIVLIMVGKRSRILYFIYRQPSF